VTDATSLPLGLVAIVARLDETEVARLVARLKLRIDPEKRLSPVEQLARALVAQPELREPQRLGAPCATLLQALARSGGTLAVANANANAAIELNACDAETTDAALELVSRGLAFRQAHGHSGYELVIPASYIIQVPLAHGEDPRSLRALLLQTSPEAKAAIASFYLGRAATQPIALSLEPAWQSLQNTSDLSRLIENLNSDERHVLDAVVELGGEVDTQELLDLEREPMRVRTTFGFAPSRRGAAYALERRGLLIALHPNRHVVATEVAHLIDSDRSRIRERARAHIQLDARSIDHTPTRARFSSNPAVCALAAALVVRQLRGRVRDDVGTPTSLIAKLANRLGRSAGEIAMVAALSRAIGLWSDRASSAASPPGSSATHTLAHSLFQTWLAGGVWDEARAEPETLRHARDQRESPPTQALRRLILETLAHVADEAWVPYLVIERLVQADARTPGIERLIARAAQRSNVAMLPIGATTRRIVLESLFYLGAIDTSDPANGDTSEALVPCIRLTPRGRQFIADAECTEVASANEVRALDPLTIRIGGSTPTHHVLAASDWVEVGETTEALELIVSEATLQRAFDSGVGVATARQHLRRLAPIPEPVEHFLERAETIVAQARVTPCTGFLWTESDDLRERLLSHPATARLFVHPSPIGGLLIGTSIDLDQIRQRCRRAGVDVRVDGDSSSPFVATSGALTASELALSPAHPASNPRKPRRVRRQSRT